LRKAESVVQKKCDHRERFGGKFESQSQRISKSATNGRAKFNISITIRGRIDGIGFSERENSALSFESYFGNIRPVEMQKRCGICFRKKTKSNKIVPKHVEGTNHA